MTINDLNFIFFLLINTSLNYYCSSASKLAYFLVKKCIICMKYMKCFNIDIFRLYIQAYVCHLINLIK